jgi:thioredoxin reductase
MSSALSRVRLDDITHIQHHRRVPATAPRDHQQDRMESLLDPTSIAGKQYPLESHWPLVVVGAGAAGLACAIAAAGHGLSVLLVDEHPVAAGLMGMDVPYMFGERVNASAQNKARMIERVVAGRPEIERAFEVGVEVRLGTYVWGAFVNGPTSQSLPHPVLGLADDERSWLISFDRLIVATGARDLGLAFPGWDRPGVVGVRAAAAAIDMYGAFSGRRLVVLGAGACSLGFAVQAHEAGCEIVSVLDVAPRAHTPEVMRRAVHARHIPIETGELVRGTIGRLEVEGVLVAPVADAGRTREIGCDTIICGVDVVPTIELFDLLGCAVVWRSEFGGYVPRLDPEARTSVPGVYAVGDCAGVSDAALGDAGRAARAGTRLAAIVARDAGRPVDVPLAEDIPSEALFDRDEMRRDWLRAYATEEALVVCRCESVTIADLLGVRPPRYLAYDAAHFAARDVRTLAAGGAANQDQVKRLTRAGMGACQGRRCREQVQVLLAMQGNLPTGSVPLASYRAPLRPLPLSVLTADDEPQSVRDGWSAWFGIPSMWTPHWEPHSGEDVFLEARLGLSRAVK